MGDAMRAVARGGTLPAVTAPPSCVGSATPGLIRTLPTATRSSGSAAARLEGNATAAVVARRTPLRPRTHWAGRCGIDRACAAAAMRASMAASRTTRDLEPRCALSWQVCRRRRQLPTKAIVNRALYVD
eukprot:scaffold60743_cov63-Phaeocystis_antarctica.AAC.4